jgi:hypothetical protein
MKIKIVIIVSLHCVITRYIKFAIVKNRNINLYIHRGFISIICNGCVADDIHEKQIFTISKFHGKFTCETDLRNISRDANKHLRFFPKKVREP